MVKWLFFVFFAACSLHGEAPRRLFSSSTMGTAAVIGLGAGERLAAIEGHGRVVPGTEGAAVVGAGQAVSAEKLLELGVDHALVWYYQGELIRLCHSLGIPVTVIPEVRLANYAAVVSMLGAVLELDAAAFTAEFEEAVRELEAARPDSGSRRVYLELYAPFATVGGNSYLNDLLELAGGVNIARGMERSGLISPEAVMEAQPEVILYIEGFGSAEEMAERPGFAELPAVRAGAIHSVEREKLTAGVDPAGLAAEFRRLLGE